MELFRMSTKIVPENHNIDKPNKIKKECCKRITNVPRNLCGMRVIRYVVNTKKFQTFRMSTFIYNTHTKP